MDKLKEIGLRIACVFLMTIGLLFGLFGWAMVLIMGAIHNWARDIMIKFSWDDLDDTWDQCIDELADLVDKLKQWILTAKVEL